MSTALDAIVAHFEGLETRTIEVPEWVVDGQPLEIFVTPMTLGEQSKFHRQIRDLDDVESAIVALILFAKDGAGEPLFDIGDKSVLRRKCSPDVLGRVAKQVIGLDVDPADGDDSDGDGDDTGEDTGDQEAQAEKN